MMWVLLRMWVTARLRERVEMNISEIVGVFEGMRDEVAVVLPVVIDAVVLVVSALLDVAISNDTNNNG